MRLENVIQRDALLLKSLSVIWESSVKATHTFLSNKKIQKIKPVVEYALGTISKLVIMKDENSKIIAFMGIDKDKIEMLFVAPEARGCGVGEKMIIHAKKALDCRLVDVNEQNTQAIGFYQKMGFKVVGRSAIDGQGNPYPILHMQI